MSIDSRHDTTIAHSRGAVSPPVASADASEMSSEQWDRLRTSVLRRSRRCSSLTVLGDATADGQIYRWGAAAACGTRCDPLTEVLSRLACDHRPRKKLASLIDLPTQAAAAIESTQTPLMKPSEAAIAVLWAAAMPALAEKIDQETWWELLASLQQLHESTVGRNQVDSPIHLLLAGELGLTLSWRLADLPSCSRLAPSSAAAVDAWCRADDDSIAAAITRGMNTRLVLASLIRCQRLVDHTTKKKFKKASKLVGADLAIWVASLTSRSGETAFSGAEKNDVGDDLSTNGLLNHAADFDRETVQPAIDASLGTHPKTGRLAWEVDLPESMHHDEDAKLAILLPQWDVRRGRTHIDYGGSDVVIEVFGGRCKMLDGPWQTLIEIDQEEQQARGDWELTCEYTDDDGHYLELEQPWTGGIILQRQLMLVRDDRCLLLADSVVPSDPLSQTDSIGTIRYGSRLPVAKEVVMTEESETREIFLTKGRNRSMCIPLAANEWKVGASQAALAVTNDHHLLYQVTGRDRLYAPIWFDFQQRRFRRKRTWRALTIADELRIVGNDEAVGYRVQVGPEQWMLYRSLGARRCRSLLGKHLIADFISGRFDPSDGSIEELVTVDIPDGFDD